MDWLASHRLVGGRERFDLRPAQQPKSVQGDDDRRPSVGENGQPEVGRADQGGHEEDRLEVEGEGDILADVGNRGPRQRPRCR